MGTMANHACENHPELQKSYRWKDVLTYEPYPLTLSTIPLVKSHPDSVGTV